MRPFVLCLLVAAALVACSPFERDEARDQASESDVFVPPTSREGARVAMPLTFPDDTSAELVYPLGLRLERFTIRPYSSARLQGRSPSPVRGDVVGRDFIVDYGEVTDVMTARDGGRPPRLLAEYEGAHGQRVGFWDVRWSGNVHYLAFQFGNWAVLVYDYVGAGAMTDAEREKYAASFRGRETEDGWLVLEGTGELRLARAGQHAGPQLLFSKGPARGFQLFPGRCRPHRGQDRIVGGTRVQWSDGFADWCLSDSMRIHAVGKRDFVASLIHALEIRRVAIAT
jgi:hypothetical protein